MTDVPSTPPVGPASAPPQGKDAIYQLTVAIVIVVSVTLITIGLLVVVHLEKDEMLNGAAFTVVGTVVGGLLTALNAPSGIGNVISQARKQPGNPP